jgi:hypothetical protein
MGVVPAWLGCPVRVSSCQEMPWTPVTAPMVTPASLEHWPLLDVQLDVGVRRRSGHGAVARPADPFELVAQHGAIDGDDVEGVLQRHTTRVDEAAEHVRGEAAALLVGEEGHFEGAAGADARVVEGPHHLQPGEHSEGAVVAPTGADGVDVAPRHHRRQPVGVGAGAGALRTRSGGDHVADPVDLHVEPQGAHPPHHELTASGILVGERQAAVAAVTRVADGGQGFDVGQQAVGLDLHPAIVAGSTVC